MSALTPRMRVFAGPNGSGKSTLKAVLPPPLLGVYLNPDDIERQILDNEFLDLNAYGVSATAGEVLDFLRDSPFLRSAGFATAATALDFAHGVLSFGRVTVNSYFASVVVDFLRLKLMERRRSFTFETVMSHPSKVELLARAQEVGYRTYYHSLDLLMDAVKHTNRAYVFDNSGHYQKHTWLAEITDGRVVEMKTDQVPAWFKRALLDKINPLAK